LELLIETLVELGLKPTDTQVYIFLAKKGPQRVKDLVNSLRITKQQLYPSLKNLEERCVVNSSNERPAVFSAVPIEQVLDALIKAKIKETQHMIQNKEALLSKWKLKIRNSSET
jgi:sugar-specific transcriptional regulator TrmB